jgi:hypothetical protein
MSVSESDGSKVKIHAYALKDIYDKKISTKLLRFFSSGGNLATANTFIAMKKKNQCITSNYLFSSPILDNEIDPDGNEPASLPANRALAESTLLTDCQPLTVCQRGCDWFTGRRFRFTGTI